jgi:hypothetical protein
MTRAEVPAQKPDPIFSKLLVARRASLEMVWRASLRSEP